MTRVWRIARRLLALAALLLVVALLLDRLFPPLLPDPGNSARVVVDRHGRPLRAFADAAGEWRYPVQPEQVDADFLQALLRYEDGRFERHPGVDPLALLRATAQALRHRRVVSGASTLTMQVARMLEDIPHSLGGKLWQMLRALQLEWHLDKREILALYLTHAPYGGTIQGVEAAARSYLGKSAADLSRAEAALLVVLPQAPSRLRPDRHPERARLARDKVLARMQQLGLWSAASVDAARIEPVVARSLRPPMHAPLLARRLLATDPAAVVRTTLDLDWQRSVEQRVGHWLGRLPLRTSAAVLVMHMPSGELRVHVGSGAFADPERLGHVDMSRALRSPGSTLKPFLYGMALDQHLIHSESLLVDAPRLLRGYRPGNFGGAFAGPVAASEALRRSLNVPAVELLERIGPRRFAAALGHAGLTLALPQDAEPNLSLILGGAGVRLEELLGAWRALGADGLALQPLSQPGQAREQRRLLSPQAAWIVRRMLSADPWSGRSIDAESALFVPDGDATLAWKTGTSYGFRDAWALGMRGELALAVWVGRPDGTPMPGEYGAVTALPLLVQVAESLPLTRSAQVRPPGVARAEICWPLGLRPDPAEPALCQQRRHAWIIDDVVPATLPDLDQQRWQAQTWRYQLDRQGWRRQAGCLRADLRSGSVARWPLRATPWLSASQRQASTPPPLAPDCGADLLSPPLLLVRGLEPNSTLRSSSGAGQPVQLQLDVLGNEGDSWWLLNGRLVGTTRGNASLRLSIDQPGAHELLVISADGRHRSLPFALR